MAVPTHSAWFRLDSVDDIEKRALPEFFDGSSSTKTPAAYTHMRNLMVSTFREAPNLHLSATECRRHIAADVGSVMRLHQFLEHWGIINTSTAARPPAGASALNGGGGGAAPLSAELSLRAPLAVVGGEWTAQETLGLVEALERANTGEGEQTWDDIALQVGKSAEACVTHFLSLPIEEPHAGPLLQPPASGDDAGAAVPSDDPMLVQLGLLAGAVSATTSTSSGGGGGGSASKSTKKRSKADADAGDASSAAAGPLQAAARASASSVLARAVQLHQRDDPNMHELFTSLVDAQVKLVESKLASLDELQGLVQREREQLERQRQRSLAAAQPRE